VPLAAAAGVLGAYLNVHGTFFAVGLGSAIYNAVACLAFLVPGDPGTVLWSVGVAVLAAAALRTGLLWALARAPLRPRWTAPPGIERGFWPRFGAGIGAAGIIYLAQLLFRSLAGAAEPGALAVFSYALKLFELPMGLLLAPMATVLLPTLSAADIPAPALLRRGIAAFLGVSLAALAAGWLAGDPIARLIYDRGEMTAQGMADIVRTGKLMFLALPFAALGLLGATLLNAQRRTGVVMVNAAAGLACGGGLAFLGPGFVLPGFVVFHVVHGGLNLWRSGLLGAAKG
jgi:putative peptidoglycan lipid II flippase